MAEITNGRIHASHFPYQTAPAPSFWSTLTRGLVFAFVLVTSAVAWQMVSYVAQLREAATEMRKTIDSIQADRAIAAKRDAELEAARKKQVVNEATLLLRQEENLRLVEKMKSALTKGD